MSCNCFILTLNYQALLEFISQHYFDSPLLLDYNYIHFTIDLSYAVNIAQGAFQT